MDNISRIRRVSGRFRVFFSVLVICIPMLDVLFWVLFNYLPDNGGLILRMELSHELDGKTRFLLFLASLLPIAVVTYGIFSLARLFRLYENAVVFTASNVKHYRNLGYVIVFWVAAKFLYTPISTIIISLGKPDDERFVTVGFGLLDVFTLMVGVIVILISWVMDEGRKLEEEQAHTV